MDTRAVMEGRRQALRKGNPHWRRGAVRKKDRGQNNRPKEWRNGMDQTSEPDFNTLIPVSGDAFPVDARKLHAVLGPGREFNAWITGRITGLGFEIGKDFRTFSQSGEAGQDVRNYSLSLDMAKHLAMIERTPMGRRARDYFIDCERRLLAGAPVSALPTHLETAQALVVALTAKQQLERQIASDAPKVEFHHRVFESEGAFTIAEAAKALRTGEHRLFAVLRGRGYLMDSNLPFQDHIERGLFRVVVKTGEWGGMTRTYRQTLITAKGMAVLGPALADLLPPLPAQQTNPRRTDAGA